MGDKSGGGATVFLGSRQVQYLADPVGAPKLSTICPGLDFPRIPPGKEGKMKKQNLKQNNGQWCTFCKISIYHIYIAAYLI